MIIRLLLRKILVEFQPDIPILMIMGGDLTRLCTVRMGFKWRPSNDDPQTPKLWWTYNENVMDLKALDHGTTFITIGVMSGENAWAARWR
jgi:hypothetical protein